MIKISIAAAVAAAALSSSAFAGFTASTGLDTYSYTAPGTALAPAVGGNYTVTSKPLATYTPDGAADPQILPGDLANVLFSLSLNVASVNAGTGAVTTTGTYSIVYGPGNIAISTGTANLALTPVFGGFNVASGALTQTAGPANPAFRDLAYGNNANIVFQGGYLDANTGTIALNLRQNAIAPEPTTLATLAGVSVLGLRRRRA